MFDAIENLRGIEEKKESIFFNIIVRRKLVGRV
jgi:hypothetical protein